MKKPRYLILVNPASGKTSIDTKRIQLKSAATILQAKIHGLDTNSPEDFRNCALEFASQCDVLVAAGGDGTFSSLINAFDTAITPVAYLPLGSGNALQYALNYRGSLADIAQRIQKGVIRQYDLINCNQNRRAFMVSLGIEGTILKLRDRFLQQGLIGFYPYLKAVFFSVLKAYTPAHAVIRMDNQIKKIPNLLSLMIMKQPYYGYGMKVMPKARFDDQRLHVSHIDSDYSKIILAGVTSFSIGNCMGQYLSCKKVSVRFKKPLYAQIDGDVAWKAEKFYFEILPGVLRIKC
jgi:diacylglycerol kinase (ATP)